MRFQFKIDELKEWRACAPSLALVSQRLQPSGRYRLEDLVELGLSRNEIMWFITHVGQHDLATMDKLRSWARVVDVTLPEGASFAQCWAAVHAASATHYLNLRERGVGRAEAKQQVRGGQFAKLLEVFRD